MHLYSRNPHAPKGVTALVFQELTYDLKIIIHRPGKPAEAAIVVKAYRGMYRVHLRYANGRTDTVWAADIGVAPEDGWSRTYTVRAPL